MKKFIALAAVAAVAAIAAPAFAADSSTNVTVGYSGYDIAGDSPGAISGSVGWTEGNVGIEGEGAFGAQSSSSGTGVNKVSVKLSDEFGLFATAQADVSKDFELLARAGYATADFKASGPGAGGNSSANGSGFAYGAGAAVMFSNTDGVRADYTVYDLGLDTGGSSHHTSNADVWSVAWMHKFK